METDGWVVSTRYKELAEQFQAYEPKNGAWFTERSDERGVISFSRGQEGIYFVRSRTQVPNMADIIVEIY